MTNRPCISQQMRAGSESQPLPSTWSRTVKISTATAITGRSRRPDYSGSTGTGRLRQFTSSFKKNKPKLRT